MSRFTYSPAVAGQLALAGWDAGRVVDISHLGELIPLGLFSVAESVLQSFYKLIIPPISSEANRFSAEPVAFTPEDAFEGHADRFPDWKNPLGMDIYPLSTYGTESAILMASNGMIYLTYGFHLWLVRDAFPDALDTLLTAGRTPHWFVPGE